MPNNENNYRIQLEFAPFLRGLPGFRITDSELAGYVNIAMMQTTESDSSAYFSRSSSQFTGYGDLFLVHQLFKELEKTPVDANELDRIGKIVKAYLHLLRQIAVDRGYYRFTPGIAAGVLFVLLSCLVFFPDNRALIYSSLITDLYGLGFWIFSVWSSSQYDHSLTALKNQLKEKIRFLKSLSFPVPRATEGSFDSILPSYQDVLLEDAMQDRERSTIPTIPSRIPNFFYLSALNECNHSNDNGNTDPRPERCYSI